MHYFEINILMITLDVVKSYISKHIKYFLWFNT